MRRASIIQLMGVVLAVAVGFAALRASNGYWAGGLLMVTLGLLGYAILACVHDQGPGRAAWLGFLVAGGGYLLAVKLLPLGDTTSLPTTQLIQHGQRRLLPPDTPFNTISFSPFVDDSALRPPSAPDIAPSDPFFNTNWMSVTGPDSLTTAIQLKPGARHRSFFYGIGHTLFAWLFGGIGALVSRRMWRSTAREAPGNETRGEG